MQGPTFSASLYANITTETDNMRATLAGLPRPARLMLGLFSAGAFLFCGRVLLEEKPVIGWILIGLGAIRLSAWLRQATAIARSRDETEDPEDEPQSSDQGARDGD